MTIPLPPNRHLEMKAGADSVRTAFVNTSPHLDPIKHEGDARLLEMMRVAEGQAQNVIELADEVERLRQIVDKVREYARDRDFHAKGHLNRVNSGRIASDLFAIVYRPEDDTERPVPEEVAGS